MIILTIQEWDKLPPSEANALTYQRLIRDHIAAELRSDLEGYFGGEIDGMLEEMMAGRYVSSNANRICLKFALGAGAKFISDKVSLFVKVINRIARLERERCGLHIDSVLANA